MPSDPIISRKIESDKTKNKHDMTRRDTIQHNQRHNESNTSYATTSTLRMCALRKYNQVLVLGTRNFKPQHDTTQHNKQTNTTNQQRVNK